MIFNCDTLDLRAFIVLMELSNFRRAADVLNMSQPALSRRIQKLEQAVGAQLFQRTTRQVTPTAIGRELEPLARRLIDEFDASLFSFRDMGVRRAALITMACLPTAAFYFLPSFIRAFNVDYPDVRIRVLDLTANAGVDAVSRGEAEFGINFMGAGSGELEFLPLGEDPFVLAALKDHPLMQKDEVEWADLHGHRLITVDRSSGNRTLLDAALARDNLKINWFFETTHLSTSLGFVEAGLGISVLPKLATPMGGHPIITTRPLKSPSVSRTIGIIKRRNFSLSPPAQQFVDRLVQSWRNPG